MSGPDSEEFQFQIVGDEDSNVVELTAGTVANERDATDIVGNAHFMGASYLLVDAQRLAAEFFDLSSGLAGAVMQKAANYRVCLVVIGYDASDGSNASGASDSLRALIQESNSGTTAWFVIDRNAALARVAAVRAPPDPV